MGQPPHFPYIAPVTSKAVLHRIATFAVALSDTAFHHYAVPLLTTPQCLQRIPPLKPVKPNAVPPHGVQESLCRQIPTTYNFL